MQRKSRADGIQIRRVGGVVCQGNSPVVTDEKGAGFLSFVCRLRNTKQYTEIPVGGETHKGLHTPKKKTWQPWFCSTSRVLFLRALTSCSALVYMMSCHPQLSSPSRLRDFQIPLSGDHAVLDVIYYSFYRHHAHLGTYMGEVRNLTPGPRTRPISEFCPAGCRPSKIPGIGMKKNQKRIDNDSRQLICSHVSPWGCTPLHSRVYSRQ